LTLVDEHISFREEARMEYLLIAQDLEMYGITYFKITNKNKTELYLGVDALGLNIYDRRDKSVVERHNRTRSKNYIRSRLIPKIGFPWNEVGNISYQAKKFIIKAVDTRSPPFIFYAERRRINRQMLALCKSNHELYARRRQSDSNEIRQMKQRAEQRRTSRQAERLMNETMKQTSNKCATSSCLL
jgi:hypothetical protein